MYLRAREGIKLYANRGKVEVEAQNERMRLTSRHGMKISSTEDVVEIEAEKELVLKCGKAYIRLSGGGVEVGGPKNILLKSANVQKMSKAQLPVEMPVLPGKGSTICRWICGTGIFPLVARSTQSLLSQGLYCRAC